MTQTSDPRLLELQDELATAIAFLQRAREVHWTDRLKTILDEVRSSPESGVRNVLAAFSGEHGFHRLYLSGPRNGHNLSERQEIEANGKLHVIRSNLQELASAIACSITPS